MDGLSRMASPAQRRLDLPIERCDGNLSSTRMFVGHMLEHSLVGRQDMENSKTMIMDGEIADEMGDLALPGLRSEFLNRRSFLFGSAVSLGALGLAGCATTDDMARMSGEALRARARQEIRDTSGRRQQDRSEILSPDRALRHP